MKNIFESLNTVVDEDFSKKQRIPRKLKKRINKIVRPFQMVKYKSKFVRKWVKQLKRLK